MTSPIDVFLPVFYKITGVSSDHVTNAQVQKDVREWDSVNPCSPFSTSVLTARFLTGGAGRRRIGPARGWWGILRKPDPRAIPLLPRPKLNLCGAPTPVGSSTVERLIRIERKTDEIFEILSKLQKKLR